MWSKVAVESFSPQSYGTSQQRDISAAIDFFDMTYITKMFLFSHMMEIREEPAKSDHDALCIKG